MECPLFQHNYFSKSPIPELWYSNTAPPNGEGCEHSSCECQVNTQGGGRGWGQQLIEQVLQGSVYYPVSPSRPSLTLPLPSPIPPKVLPHYVAYYAIDSYTLFHIMLYIKSNEISSYNTKFMLSKFTVLVHRPFSTTVQQNYQGCNTVSTGIESESPPL